MSMDDDGYARKWDTGFSRMIMFHNTLILMLLTRFPSHIMSVAGHLKD
jgi:hypothetical protein